MDIRLHRSAAEFRHAKPSQPAKPWTKLFAFLALIAIPAICTALYTTHTTL